MKRTIIETDNRDYNTTTVTLDNKDTVDVDVLELFVNVIENTDESNYSEIEEKLNNLLNENSCNCKVTLSPKYNVIEN